MEEELEKEREKLTTHGKGKRILHTRSFNNSECSKIDFKMLIKCIFILRNEALICLVASKPVNLVRLT